MNNFFHSDFVKVVRSNFVNFLIEFLWNCNCLSVCICVYEETSQKHTSFNKVSALQCLCFAKSLSSIQRVGFKFKLSF